MGNCCFVNQYSKYTYENSDEFHPSWIPIRKGKIVKVIDGDTYWIVSQPDHWNKTYRFRVRLMGADTPESSMRQAKSELEKKAGVAVKEYVKSRIENHECIVRIESESRDKYGRILANIIVKDGYCTSWNLTRDLVSKGYAKSYEGGSKEWTENELNDIINGLQG